MLSDSGVEVVKFVEDVDRSMTQKVLVSRTQTATQARVKERTGRLATVKEWQWQQSAKRKDCSWFLSSSRESVKVRRKKTDPHRRAARF
jgi:hypothetical protein